MTTPKINSEEDTKSPNGAETISDNELIRYLIKNGYKVYCILPILLGFILIYSYFFAGNLIEKTVNASETVMLKEYEIHIDLYKNYIDLGLSAVTFFFLITGGILTYILKNESETNETTILSRSTRKESRSTRKESKSTRKDKRNIKQALLLPILLSNVFGCIFIYGAVKWYEVKNVIDSLRFSLKIQRVPDVEILLMMLIVFGIVFFIVGLFLISLLGDENFEEKSGKN